MSYAPVSPIRWPISEFISHSSRACPRRRQTTTPNTPEPGRFVFNNTKKSRITVAAIVPATRGGVLRRKRVHGELRLLLSVRLQFKLKTWTDGSPIEINKYPTRVNIKRPRSSSMDVANDWLCELPRETNLGLEMRIVTDNTLSIKLSNSHWHFFLFCTVPDVRFVVSLFRETDRLFIFITVLYWKTFYVSLCVCILICFRIYCQLYRFPLEFLKCS